MVIGSPAKEMRFVPQRQTDSVVILSLKGRKLEVLIRKSSRDSLNLGVLLARINQEIFKLVNSR